MIRERLAAPGGHVTNAARSLGLERSHLYKKCKQLGVDIREEDLEQAREARAIRSRTRSRTRSIQESRSPGGSGS